MANVVNALVVVALVAVFAVVLTRGGGEQPAAGDARPSVTPSTAAGDAAPVDGPSPQAKAEPGRKVAPRMLLGPRFTLEARPRPPKPELPAFETIPGASFQIASFNVLGHKHTLPGGHAARYAGSAVRMARTVAAWNRHGLDVIGTQEMQPENIAAFHRNGGGTYAIFPGSSRGREAGANSIVWRRSAFALVSAHFLPVKYFGGKEWPMPYVRLRHLATGQEIWVLNVHNPADKDAPAANRRYRAIDLAREAALARQLGADGTPVFLTGDYNDRGVVYCTITDDTELKAANGGGTDPCAPPRRMDVDWVFGSESVGFSGFASLRMGGISDHPLVLATATLPERQRRLGTD